jgi:NAD(P)-dependent dehydrogenase (short-subunit alcohol dehydrogenase family)
MTTLSNATMTEPKFRTAAGTDHSPSSATGAILVTGAGGEMGHALLEALAKRYHGAREIVAMDLRELSADRAAHTTKSYAGDVSDPALADEIASATTSRRSGTSRRSSRRAARRARSLRSR